MFSFWGSEDILETRAARDTDKVPASIFLDSSMVEHSAVNRGVVGSSPTRGVRTSGGCFTGRLTMVGPVDKIHIYGALAQLVRATGS